MYYIGVDLGTSAIKFLLVDENGVVVNSVTKKHSIEFPKTGWSQQNPGEWWTNTIDGIKELIKGIDASSVEAIGSGGQMHGLVVLDEKDEVIRPCILWNDGRTQKEVDYLNNVIGKDKLSKLTANIAFAGFTAPKIMWLKENEKDNYDRINKIMLPKDYLNYKLTGVHCTDYSDASGMLLLDVEHKCWSKEMCEITSTKLEWLPKLFESYEVVGNIKEEVAKELGLRSDVKVVAGAGDNAAAAIGTNTIENGKCNISLGTSGTIFISSDKFSVDSNNALHSFAHASGKYHLMGCMLSAASCNKWFYEEILKDDRYDDIQSEITIDDLGNNKVFFLPYLMGERSPINDVDARACFVGMSMDSTRKDMTQAILEGVCFAIKDSLEVAKSLGINVTRSTICGGGGKVKIWQEMMANILNVEIEVPVSEEGPGYGGAMLAMVGSGRYKTVKECAEALCKIKNKVSPRKDLCEKYQKKYKQFSLLYPSLKDTFKKLQED